MAEFNPGSALLNLPVESIGNPTLSTELGAKPNAPVSQDISAVAGWLASIAQAFGVTTTEIARAAAEDTDSIVALGDKAASEGLVQPPPTAGPQWPDFGGQGAGVPSPGYAPTPNIEVKLPVNEEVQPGLGAPYAQQGPYRPDQEPVAATAPETPSPAAVAAASPTGGQAPADVLSGIKMPLGPQGGPPPAGAAAPRPQLQPSELDALIGAVMAKSGAAGQAGLTLGTQLRR